VSFAQHINVVRTLHSFTCEAPSSLAGNAAALKVGAGWGMGEGLDLGWMVASCVWQLALECMMRQAWVGWYGSGSQM
jgi:hypothetical protein